MPAPFGRIAYDSIADKLDAEAALHNGYGWSAWLGFYRLHTANPKRLGFADLAYLMGVSSPNTIKSWIAQTRAHEGEAEAP